MNEMLKKMMANLNLGGDMPEPIGDRGMPTGITRCNLNEIYTAGVQLTAMCATETDFYDRKSPAPPVAVVLKDGVETFFRTLGKSGVAMTWEEVRAELSGTLTILAHALTPEGRAALLGLDRPKPSDKPDYYKPSVN